MVGFFRGATLSLLGLRPVTLRPEERRPSVDTLGHACYPEPLLALLLTFNRGIHVQVDLRILRKRAP